MCETCASGVTVLELAELDAEIIRLEADAGWTVPHATRPLHEHEIRARVRFGELDRIATEAAQLVARHAGRVREATLDALAEDLLTHEHPYALVARLNELTSPTSRTSLPIADVLRQVTREIETTLGLTLTSTAAATLAEATAQGVAAAGVVDVRRDLNITPETRSMLGEVARQVAEQPMVQVLEAAAKGARGIASTGTPIHRVTEAAMDAAEGVSSARLDDEARQAATKAANAGRAAATTRLPAPQEVYASELMDGATCQPCATVDGRMYESLDAALVDYPATGTFSGCLGGGRCRGTLVYVWATESAPTLDQPGDGPMPAHPIDRTPKGPATGGANPETPARPIDADTPAVLDPTIGRPAAAERDLIAVREREIQQAQIAANMGDHELEAAINDAMTREDWDAVAIYGDEIDARNGSAFADGPSTHTPNPAGEAEVALDDAIDSHNEFYDESKWLYNEGTGEWQFLGGTAAERAAAGTTAKARREAAKQAWAEHCALEEIRAEEFTRGVMVRRDREAEFRATYGPTDNGILFSGRLDVAYYFASEELRAYWWENTRLSWSEFAVRMGIADAKTLAAAARAPKWRDDLDMRAQEDPEKRRERQRLRRERRKIR